jgi:Ni/Fe-hydrogenase subunit HybB-like protein
VLRIVDLAWRGVIPEALSLDFYSILFLCEFLLTLVPAVVLLAPEARSDPRTLFNMTLLIAISGLAYRFIPTTVAYLPDVRTRYFPSVRELFIGFGLLSIGTIAYLVAVKRFAVLPAPLSEWYETMPEMNSVCEHEGGAQHGNQTSHH